MAYVVVVVVLVALYLIFGNTIRSFIMKEEKVIVPVAKMHLDALKEEAKKIDEDVKTEVKKVVDKVKDTEKKIETKVKASAKKMTGKKN